jgi:mono/diheme cytochrome c family protein
MKLRSRYALTLWSLALAGLLLLALPATAEDVPAGQQTFVDAKCATCHSVAAVGIEAKVKSEKMRGTDLSGYTAEDPAAVMAFLRKEAQMDGEDHKKEIKASDEELQAIFDWLATLEPAE